MLCDWRTTKDRRLFRSSLPDPMLAGFSLWILLLDWNDADGSGDNSDLSTIEGHCNRLMDRREPDVFEVVNFELKLENPLYLVKDFIGVENSLGEFWIFVTGNFLRVRRKIESTVLKIGTLGSLLGSSFSFNGDC